MPSIGVPLALLLLLTTTATAEVANLSGANFRENMNCDGSLWFINFFVDWCPWSQKLAPEWEELGNDEKVRQAGVKIGAVDCTTSMALCWNVSIAGYPTMWIFFNGEKWQGDQCDGESNDGNYHGDRDVESLKAFALKTAAQIAPHNITAATAAEDSKREEAPTPPRFSVGMVLKFFGFPKPSSQLALREGSWDIESGGR